MNQQHTLRLNGSLASQTLYSLNHAVILSFAVIYLYALLIFQNMPMDATALVKVAFLNCVSTYKDAGDLLWFTRLIRLGRLMCFNNPFFHMFHQCAGRQAHSESNGGGVSLAQMDHCAPAPRVRPDIICRHRNTLKSRHWCSWITRFTYMKWKG